MIRLFEDNRKTYLAKENTTCLKGFLALVIVLVHIRGHLTILNDTIIGQILTAAGYLSVGVFFFISGYGLNASYDKIGKQYLARFIQNRFLPFYCSCVLVVFIYILFYLIVGERLYLNLPNILRSLTYGGTLVQNGWYLQTIILFYLIFWIVFSLVKEEKMRLVFLFGGTSLYCLLCIVKHQDPYTYVSSYAFLMGVAWCQNKGKIEKAVIKTKNYLQALILLLVGFCITLLLGNYPILPNTAMVVACCLSSLFFVAFVLFLLMRVRISYRVLHFLGTISFELYVFHGIFILLFTQIVPIQNPAVFLLLVVGCGICLSYILKPLVQLVAAWVRKWCNQKIPVVE